MARPRSNNVQINISIPIEWKNEGSSAFISVWSFLISRYDTSV